MDGVGWMPLAGWRWFSTTLFFANFFTNFFFADFFCWLFIDNAPIVAYKKLLYAGVVKLVDAEDSKSSGLTSVSVQFRPPAPFKYRAIWLNIRGHLAKYKRGHPDSDRPFFAFANVAFAKKSLFTSLITLRVRLKITLHV